MQLSRKAGLCRGAGEGMDRAVSVCPSSPELQKCPLVSPGAQRTKSCSEPAAPVAQGHVQLWTDIQKLFRPFLRHFETSFPLFSKH